MACEKNSRGEECDCHTAERRQYCPFWTSSGRDRYASCRRFAHDGSTCDLPAEACSICPHHRRQGVGALKREFTCTPEAAAVRARERLEYVRRRLAERKARQVQQAELKKEADSR